MLRTNRPRRHTLLAGGTLILLLGAASASLADTSNWAAQWARAVETGRAHKRLTPKAGRTLVRAKLRQMDGPRAWAVQVLGDATGMGEHRFRATTLTKDGPFVRTGMVNLRADPTISPLGFTGRTRCLGRVSVTTREWNPKTRGYDQLPGPSAPIRPARPAAHRPGNTGTPRPSRGSHIRTWFSSRPGGAAAHSRSGRGRR